MKIVYPTLLILFLVIISVKVNAQKLDTLNHSKVTPFNPDFCATDFFHTKKMKSDSGYKQRYLKTNKSIKKNTFPKNVQSNGIFQIPVVVHVMHKGEPVGTGTNITDEDVKKGVKYLNNYWRKVSNSRGFGDGVDMKMEFVLAIQDENGNCTNGIDRVDMSGVSSYVNYGVNGSQGLEDYNQYGGVNSLKEYSIWNPSLYYNVWLVDEIDNKNCSSPSYTSGYAYYASSHGQLYDGSVVLICSYLNEASSTWAHEMGHAFDLAHTFDGDDSNGNPYQCGDDGISDTPRHIRTSSISPSIYFNCNNSDSNSCDPSFDQIINPETGFRRNTGTHQDHMHNYMDYTGCPTEFTGGQRAVVQSALANTRDSFLTSPGLVPASTASVGFTATTTTACLGSAITFNDESTCTPNSYTDAGYDGITFYWTFDNGVDPPFTSTKQNPTIIFDKLGVYDVTLAVTNLHGTTSLTKYEELIIASGAKPGCSISSSNNNVNYGCGVTNISFNTLNKKTSTFIPPNATQDFACIDNTTLSLGDAYNLNVTYKSIGTQPQYLKVWIDWDNSGTFDDTNSYGDNEGVLIDAIVTGSPTTKTVSSNVVMPANVVLNTLLRMRVISSYFQSPVLCGAGFVQRADDYAIYIKPNCIKPNVVIVNNTGETELSCNHPSISVTATGGVSYSWNNGLGNSATVSITNAGTYTVTATNVNGCTARKNITIIDGNPPSPGSVTQSFLPGDTVANLNATGTNIKWYSAASGGTPLASTTALVNGTVYYASQTVNGCESLVRLGVTVTIFSLPYNNFLVTTKSESCLGKNNGEIRISATEVYPYVATINGTNYTFTNNSLVVSNLSPANYNVCISVEGRIFQQCFAITIEKGTTLTGKSTVSSNKAMVEITKGTPPFEIIVNNIPQFETTKTNFSVDVKQGDLLEVKTSVVCEGIYSKNILDGLIEAIAHPNPTDGVFEITVPTSEEEVEVELYTMSSQLLSKRKYPVINQIVRLSLEKESDGVYIAKVNLESPVSLTIIKISK